MSSIWWHKPTLRREGEDDIHRTATPLDLFFDLVFVAIIAVLAHQLAKHMGEHGGWHSILEFALLFIPVWWFWIGNTYYNERFGTNDVSHRLFTFMQMIPAAAMAYFAHSGLDPKATVGFALCYAAARIFLVLLWLRGGYYNPEARKYVGTLSFGFSLSILLFIVSAFVDPPIRYTLWIVGLAIDLITPLFLTKETAKLPKFSQHHITERFNLFTIIVLGESIAAAVAGASKANVLTGSTAWAGVFGIINAALFWFMYFDQVMNGVRKEGHGSRFIWVYGHLPFVMGMTIIGAGVLYVVGHADDHLKDAIRWLICGGAALGIASLFLIETSLKGYIDGMDNPISFKIARIASVIACLGLGYWGHGLNAVPLQGIIMLILLFQSIFGLALWVRAVKRKGAESGHGWTI